MKSIIITFGSVTYAMKAKKILTKAGITSSLIKVGDELLRGCTHGIEISNASFLDAIAALRNAGIDYSVYNA